MSERLPPLNALRAFEAAARHLSFTAAAGELHVTPGAISHQVRGLEEYLGTPLFRRVDKRLLLSDAARAFLPEIQEGFARLNLALRRLRSFEDHGSLVVHAGPVMAAKWLVPRLHRFQEAQPAIDVRIVASMDLADFSREEVDVAVRFGAGAYPGLFCEKLADVSFVPVCSPALRARSPEDLARSILIHDETVAGTHSFPGWRDWFAAAGLDGVDTARGPRFSNTILALEAAAAGKGVALAMDLLAETDLAAGRLVQPVGPALPFEFGYHVVSPPAAAALPKVTAFRAWVKAEAAGRRRPALDAPPLPPERRSA